MPFGLYQHRTPPRGVFLGLTAVLGLGVLLFILPSSLPDKYTSADLIPFRQSPSSQLDHDHTSPTPLSRTKFLFDESRYPPPSAPFEQKPEQEPFFNFDVSPVKEEGMMVPNAVHYIWMSRASVKEVEASREAGRPLPGSVFPYYAYLSVRSALLVLKPHRLYFHYDNLPTGPWFEALKPRLTLNQVPTPTRVYDQWLELSAHRADIMRIMALKALGGIYLDLDIYIVRPFDEFMYAPFTLGIEAYPGSSGAAKGLCNAVIISEVNATFLEPWMRSFMEFRHDLYEYNAIIKPWYIARFDHSLVQVVTHEAFFNPTWDENEITMVFETDEWDFDATGQCAYHAWHSVKPQYLSNLNPREVRKGGTSFTNLVKRYIGDEDEALWDSFGSR